MPEFYDIVPYLFYALITVILTIIFVLVKQYRVKRRKYIEQCMLYKSFYLAKSKKQ